MLHLLLSQKDWGGKDGRGWLVAPRMLRPPSSVRPMPPPFTSLWICLNTFKPHTIMLLLCLYSAWNPIFLPRYISTRPPCLLISFL